MDTDDEKQPIKDSFHQENGDDRKANTRCNRCPQRYLLAIMAFFGFMNLYLLRANLSVAIVAMVNNRTEVINGTETMVADFDWDSKMQGLVLSAFFYGYIVTVLPGGVLAKRIGGKHVYGFGILGPAILTLLTPVAARLSVWLLVAVRVMEGLFEMIRKYMYWPNPMIEPVSSRPVRSKQLSNTPILWECVLHLFQCNFGYQNYELATN